MKPPLFLIFILLASLGCKEKYVSSVVSPATGYLVVEGVVNAGGGETNIYLSRTSPLEMRLKNYETGATVSIMGEDNSSYRLNELDSGHYQIAHLSLKKNVRYKLAIKTMLGVAYQSDYCSIQTTPVIDSVNWQVENNGIQSGGVQIYVNAHDNTNATQYYQWDYTETYEYNSPWKVFFKFVQINQGPTPLFDVNRINFNNRGEYDTSSYRCWPTVNSSSILIGTTDKLNENKIHLPLIYITENSERFAILYSILVRQYSLSNGKYSYLDKMKKNTELTGSIMDPQPSELKGNIHNINNPSEPVVGYIDFSEIQEIRTFIKNQDIPNWKFESPCLRVDVPNRIDTITKAKITYWVTGIHIPGIQEPISYWFTYPDCADCKFHGTNAKPSFWPTP